MTEPLILGCACGRDHWTMPVDTDEDGTEYPLVCLVHKKHEPCRACLWNESGATTNREYRDWLREGVEFDV